MKNTLAYLKYLYVHKKAVYKAGRVLDMSRIQLLIHDLSKYRPSEWKSYMASFYTGAKTVQYKNETLLTRDAFNRAWCFHIHRNPHHWQHWILNNDDGTQELLEIPVRYIAEMVADWAGAGYAIKGTWEVKAWYEANKEKIRLLPEDRRLVEHYIDLIDRELNSDGHAGLY